MSINESINFPQVELAKVMGIPLVISEQYPRGLGPTVSEIDTKKAVAVISKTRYSSVFYLLLSPFISVATNLKSCLGTCVLDSPGGHVLPNCSGLSYSRFQKEMDDVKVNKGK